MAEQGRKIPLQFYVSEQERELIQTKMEQYGTENMSAYLRKIAIDGYVVNLELPELGEMVSLLRRSSNNLNQLTRRVHETGKYSVTVLSFFQSFVRMGVSQKGGISHADIRKSA